MTEAFHKCVCGKCGMPPDQILPRVQIGVDSYGELLDPPHWAFGTVKLCTRCSVNCGLSLAERRENEARSEYFKQREPPDVCVVLEGSLPILDKPADDVE